MGRKSKRVRQRLGKRVQRLRKEVGYTQEELAEFMGISRTHMGHIEQGRVSPSLAVLEKIARVLKVKIGDLFS